jgi:hypothetical protein
VDTACRPIEGPMLAQHCAVCMHTHTATCARLPPPPPPLSLSPPPLRRTSREPCRQLWLHPVRSADERPRGCRGVRQGANPLHPRCSGHRCRRVLWHPRHRMDQERLRAGRAGGYWGCCRAGPLWGSRCARTSSWRVANPAHPPHRALPTYPRASVWPHAPTHPRAHTLTRTSYPSSFRGLPPE